MSCFNKVISTQFHLVLWVIKPLKTIKDNCHYGKAHLATWMFIHEHKLYFLLEILESNSNKAQLSVAKLTKLHIE